MGVDRRVRVAWSLLLLASLVFAACEGAGDDAVDVVEALDVDSPGLGDTEGVVIDVAEALDVDSPGLGDTADVVADGGDGGDAESVHGDSCVLPEPDVGGDVLVDGGSEEVVSDVAPEVLGDVGLDAAADTGDESPVCDPAEIEGRCCCSSGRDIGARCGDDGVWSCPSAIGWTEGGACEGTPCGGPCGPPCPNVCDAPDTDPGCPAGFVTVADGGCLPRDCAEEDAEPAACTPAPVTMWEGHGAFDGEGACEVGCGPESPCRAVGTWSGSLPICFSAPLDEVDGVYRTDDAGLCWERVDDLATLTFRVTSVVGMLHVPAPHDAVLLLATGGIRRSTDGGLTFSAPVPPDPTGTNQTAVHDDGVVYLIARDPPREDDWQVWRSDDGGASFTAGPGLTSSREINRLAVHPEDSDILLVTGRFYADGGMYGAMRTSDGGQSFQAVGPELVDSNEGRAVAFSPSQPSRVYLALGGHGFYRSDDAGLSWTLAGTELVPSLLGVHPDDPDGLYSGGQVSWDGGQSWSEAPEDATASFYPDYDVVCPGDGGPCDRWSRGEWIRYASGDEPWRPAMAGLPWSLSGIFWTRPFYFLPFGDGRALSVVLTQQMMIF